MTVQCYGFAEAPIQIIPYRPALILAPMEGLTDAPMRALQGESGAFTFSVSEFLRVSGEVVPPKVFRRHIPELSHGGRTPSGLPVQVQILGGDASLMAETAVAAYQAGAKAIDINFGCPAKTVNRHDGGASLLKHPTRIREIVRAVRAALPPDIPVSAKLRLGWDTTEAIFENAAMAAEGGASWLTIHARTREQGYRPPVFWPLIGRVREKLALPIVANGDIWSAADLLQCREETGCEHFMLGRGALANPHLPHQAARALGMIPSDLEDEVDMLCPINWIALLQRLAALTTSSDAKSDRLMLCKLKQWLKIASFTGSFSGFDSIKRAESVDELMSSMVQAQVP